MNFRGALSFLFLMLFLFQNGALQGQNVPNDSPERKEAVNNWRDMGFGMFIHWGAYTQFHGRWKGEELQKNLWGEWIMKRAKIPVEEYEGVVKTFNPQQFNAASWVKLAKYAGMKYMVVTAKHHDGFAMYHSKASKYNIVDFTGFDRDPMEELARECEKQGVNFGFYYSHRVDWHEPDAAGYRASKGESEKFNRYWENKCLPQVEELTTNYGNLAVMWFDLGGISKEKAVELRELVLNNQPGCIIDSRIGAGQGDYKEQKDRFVPEIPIKNPWETCMTVNNHWAWYPQDVYYKSPGDIIRMLASVRSMGGNLLLNVGPDNTGRIPLKETVILTNVGNWMKKYSEAIYAVTPSPLPQFPWGRCTRKGDKLYLHVFKWPADGTLFVPGILSGVAKVYPLNDKNENSISATKTAMGVELTINQEKLSPESVDPFVSVLAMELNSPLKTDSVTILDHDFDNVLKAVNAKKDTSLVVKNLRYHTNFPDSKIDIWKHIYRVLNFKKGTGVSWNFNNENEDIFHVIVEYALGGKDAPDEVGFELMCDGKVVPFTLTPTYQPNRDNYVKAKIADIVISKGRNKELKLVMTKPGSAEGLELVSVILKPSHLR